MPKVSTYLNFPRSTFEAFTFYKSVFGGEFGPQIARFRDMKRTEGMPPLAEADKDLIVHIELSLPGGHLLMGTDAPESMGFSIKNGNNIHISLDLDTRAETKRIFDALSKGGTVTMQLQEMFWGGYYGACTDRFGVQWMVNCAGK